MHRKSKSSRAIQVSELMTSSPVACRESDRLNEVARLMWDHDCGAIPVVDDSNRVVGMITDRDICMAAYTQGHPLADIEVASAMSPEIFACHATDSIEAAEEILGKHQVRRLPVLDASGELVGIVSINDVARQLVQGRPNGTSDHVFVETLASICAPRRGVRIDAGHQIAG